jgi:hypothetical protein
MREDDHPELAPDFSNPFSVRNLLSSELGSFFSFFNFLCEELDGRQGGEGEARATLPIL